MTPEQFIDTLGVHFTARHDTEDQMAQWFEHMVRALSGYSAKVLDKVADDIIHDRATKSFPLIAEIRKVADKHAPRSYVEQPSFQQRSLRAPDSPEQLERYRLAKEWREKVCASHGSVDAWLQATVHRREDGSKGRVPAKRSSFNKLSDVSLRMMGDAE